MLVYGLWAWFIWNSGLPRNVRAVVAPLFALWGCGVIWSRLALGAHYVTDLVGGVLLAVTGARRVASSESGAAIRSGRRVRDQRRVLAVERGLALVARAQRGERGFAPRAAQQRERRRQAVGSHAVGHRERR